MSFGLPENLMNGKGHATDLIGRDAEARGVASGTGAWWCGGRGEFGT
ncbi:MAG: hypothetical protein V2A76_13000 [Planctomycetota bacterium]